MNKVFIEKKQTQNKEETPAKKAEKTAKKTEVPKAASKKVEEPKKLKRQKKQKLLKILKLKIQHKLVMFLHWMKSLIATKKKN